MPRHELLAGSAHPQELEALIAAAEQGLRSWEPVWTDFMDGGLREEAEQRLAALAELDLASWGGFPGAERRRLLLQRRETALAANALPSGLLGLEISGNFLFDQAERADFRSGLRLAERHGQRCDRGAQAIVTASLAAALDGLGASVRSVEVRLEVRPLEQLQLPAERQPRRFQTVEASLRLDAVASAGFGLARNRMVEKIRQGKVRLNWQPISSPSRLLQKGDRVQLEGRGELRIEAVEPTKRERWRIAILRC